MASDGDHNPNRPAKPPPLPHASSGGSASRPAPKPKASRGTRVVTKDDADLFSFDASPGPSTKSRRCWRHGKMVVFDQPVAWPNRCFRTGQKPERTVEVQLEYMPGHAGCVVLGSAMFGGIGHGLGKRWAEKHKHHEHFELPMSRETFQRYDNKRWLSVGLAIFLFLAMLSGCVAASKIASSAKDTAGLLSLLSFVGLCFALLWRNDQNRPVRIVRQHENRVWITGAGEDFLDTLDEYKPK